MAAPPLYVALDAASTALTLAVALGFFWVGRWSRRGLHFLAAAGFGLVAAGFLLVSASHYGGGISPTSADAVRLVVQLAGAILLVLAYAAQELTGRSHAAAVAFASAASLVALLGVFWVVPPVGRIAPVPETFALAHAVMAVAYLGCALLAGYGWHRRPTWGRAMVPLGFLAWALSTYTWIFIDLTPGDGRFLPLVYLWRFAAIFLMIWAMVRKPRPREGHGPPA